MKGNGRMEKSMDMEHIKVLIIRMKEVGIMGRKMENVESKERI